MFENPDTTTMKVFNAKKQKQQRKRLRNKPTPHEQKLWQCLRMRQCDGYKFVRQYGIDRYIVDFYCAERKLAIELDGSQHNESEGRENDRMRSDQLEMLGIRVLRFWNNDVDKNMDGVIEVILQALKHPLASSSSE